LSLTGSKHDTVASLDEYQNMNLDNDEKTVDYYVVQTLRIKDDKDVSTLKKEEEEEKADVRMKNEADEVSKESLDKVNDKKERD